MDERNRRIRARDIGALIAKIGERGVFKAAGRALAPDLLIGIVVKAVEKKVGAHRSSAGLQYAWRGIHGWHPPVAGPVPSSASAACLQAGRSHDDGMPPA
jgi:hypothetical protein